jgi:hypothetical protein
VQSRIFLGLSHNILHFVSLHVFGSNTSLSSCQSLYFNFVNDKASLNTKKTNVSTYKTNVTCWMIYVRFKGNHIKLSHILQGKIIFVCIYLIKLHIL